ncbi:MAG: glycoside hydrolase family 3 C-terminal domain-containing protein [Ginsengibacter sp.]
MKKMISCLVLTIAVCNAMAQSNAEKAKQLVLKMTLEEKVKLVVGLGMKISGGAAGSKGPVVGETQDKVPGAAGTTFSIPRLGIPSIVLADGPAGLRIKPVRDNDSSKTFYCTAFPVAVLLASTWDTSLVESVGRAMGNEVKEYGVDILLSPALNIHRNPLGGRNFEYYSEDPVVAGNIAAAMVNGIESNSVGTSIKHFAANNQETNRNLVNTIVSERALREIYLKGFEIAVKKSQPWTVMSSYNKINGTYTSEEYDLLTSILRKEWGFKGVVMTDWFGGKDPVAQMKSGNDLLMPGSGEQVKTLMEAVQTGKLDVHIIDENAERIMKMILGSPSYAKSAFSNRPDLKAHAIVARSAAAEGMILLKNENALPLPATVKKIAAFGNTSYDFISGGTGSGDVNKAYNISLVDGLQGAGYLVDASIRSKYDEYIAAEKLKQPKKKFFFELLPPFNEMNIDQDLLVSKATEADIAFITIGRNAGEFQDRKKEVDYDLRPDEIILIKNVSAAFHAKNKKVIVILNIGGIVDVATWRENADGILLAWEGGQEGGNAVADILTGKVNPSGKLTSTFPMSYEDVPSAKNFPGKNLSEVQEKVLGGFARGYNSEVVYEEGIYVGYRYYNTFKIKPAYEFGYGLSYTEFTFSNLKLGSPVFNGGLTVTMDVTNKGAVAGKEVVQLYIKAPSAKSNKPSEELKAFAKTSLLQPGQKQSLTFHIDGKDLASFVTKQASWIAEAGTYTINIGSSSENIKLTSDFKVPKELLVEKDRNFLAPQVPIIELIHK